MPAMTIGLRAVISIDFLQARDCRQEETKILTTSTSSQSSEFKNCFFGFFYRYGRGREEIRIPLLCKEGQGEVEAILWDLSGK